ncbi:MAG: tyrosine-type recombinase/integrase [Anaerolineales bacterium]|nr:tyrosine-type recombinase/integrase [Anaerolineales bacterium]
MSDFTDLGDFLSAQGRSEHTISGYLSDIAHFSSWFEITNGEHLTPQGLTSSDVQQYKLYLQTVQNAAAATINRRLAAIRAYIFWAINSGKIRHTPLIGIKGVGEQKNSPRYLTQPEQNALLQETSKNLSYAQTAAANRQAIRDRAIVLVLLHTGLRVSELCNLELKDIKISENNGSVQVNAINERKQRAVPLNKITRQAIRDWLSVRPEVETSALFVGKHWEHTSPLLVQRVLAEFGRRAGIEVTPQELRHTFGKNLVARGLSLENVALLMGHSSLNTTKAYASSDQNDLTWAVEALVD